MRKQTKIPGSERRGRQSGSAMVELVLMAPWVFFLFVGVMDAGFYAYEAICIQNAARAGALQTAASPFAQSNTIACNAVLGEMKMLPNVAGLASCSAAPLIVTRTTYCDQMNVSPSSIACEAAATNDIPADYAQDNTSAASLVSVTYTSFPLVPVPGIITNQLTLTRTAQMRILYQ